MKNLLLVSWLLALAPFVEARTWTAADGRKIEAEFVTADASSVTIDRAGRTFKIPLTNLSSADQEFVREKLEQMPATRPTGSSIPEIQIDPSKPWEPASQSVESALRSARQLPVEDLVEPVHSIRFGGEDNLIWAPNPDGKTWDVLPFYYNGYGGYSTVAIADLGSGELKVENYPVGTNWHLCPRTLAPDGKVYISTMNRGKVNIAVYDPAANEMKLDVFPMPAHMRGETHPIICSTDGKVFAGGGHTSQAAALMMIDPESGALTDFGSCGPTHSPSNAYNYSMGADDDYVYIASGKIPWYLVAVDRKTKQSTVLAKTATNSGVIVVKQNAHGVTARVNTGNGARSIDYWCYQGKITPQTEPCPWSNTGLDLEKNLPPKPEVYTERIVPPTSDDKAEFWVKANVPNIAPDSQHPGWSAFRYDVPLYAAGSDRLIEMPDGRLFGTAGSYLGHYIYDPASGESSYMGKTSLSHYATAIHDNKIWLSGYPSSKLYVFDCTKPWNVSSMGAGPGTELLSHESPDSNPRLLGRFAESRCHKMYGAAIGASGHLYFGGRWMRTGNGGGLGWWDPAAAKEAGIHEPFSAQQITHLCAAGGGKHIAITTVKVVDNVLNKPTPNEGKLFVFDDAKKEIVHEITIEPGIKGPGPIVWAGGNRVIGWTQNPTEPQASFLWGADVEQGEVIWKKPLPFKMPVVAGSNQEEAWDFRLGPDGKIWTFMGADGKTLVRIDPQTVEIDGVAEVDKAGRIAFSGGHVYLAGSTAIRRIKGALGD